MIRRQWNYLAERYPVPKQLMVAAILFCEIYFVLLLNNGISDFHIGVQEFVATWTIFVFLMGLRIADDFKDHETDQRLFPDRPLAAGRVTHRDLWWLLGICLVITLVLNVRLMNNLPWFALLFGYGTLMSFWFFAKAKIQPNLVLAVVTHNPVAMIMNLYLLSFTITKYHLDWVQWPVILLAFTMYFPSLIWEVARKIRAPQDETAYVTYSSIFGHVKATRFIEVLTVVDILTNLALAWRLNHLITVLLALNTVWMVVQFEQHVRDPRQFKLIDRTERYTLITEGLMMAAVVLTLTTGTW